MHPPPAIKFKLKIFGFSKKVGTVRESSNIQHTDGKLMILYNTDQVPVIHRCINRITHKKTKPQGTMYEVVHSLRAHLMEATRVCSFHQYNE